MITGGPSKPFTRVPTRSLAFGLMGPMIRVQPRAFAQARAASKSARADLGVVLALEPAPVRGALAVGLLPQLVVDRDDPAHGPAVAAREQELGRGVLEERVLRPVQLAVVVDEQRGHPVRVAAVAAGTAASRTCAAAAGW